MGPPTEQSLDLCVFDLLIPNERQWDRARIQLLLPECEEKILCIKSSITEILDKIVWLGTKSGEYTAKSGYSHGEG